MKCEEKLAKVREIIDGDCADGELSIVVLHRGWIFAGALTGDATEGYRLDKCMNVRSWANGGFGGLTMGAKSSGAKLDAARAIEFEADAAILIAPLARGWRDA
jgi:hypothetical protein